MALVIDASIQKWTPNIYQHSPLRYIVEMHREACQHWALLLILLLGPEQHFRHLQGKVEKERGVAVRKGMSQPLSLHARQL